MYFAMSVENTHQGKIDVLNGLSNSWSFLGLGKYKAVNWKKPHDTEEQHDSWYSEGKLRPVIH